MFEEKIEKEDDQLEITEIKNINTDEIDKEIVEAAKILKEAKRIVLFTGAGMSAESGIDTFRGSGGFWSGITGYIALGFFGTPVGWNTLSRLSWNLYVSNFYNPIAQAKPNDGHEAIAEMEKIHKNVTVITQNVDGLHQRAGSSVVYELHGTVQRHRCINNGHIYQFDKDEEIPSSSPCCKECGSYLRPDCTLFTESLPPDFSDAHRLVSTMNKKDVMIIVGTSATVYPAASLPEIASKRGAKIFEVNLEQTNFNELSNYSFLKGGAAKVLPQLLKALKSLNQ